MATVKLTQKEQHILKTIATKPSKSGWVRYFDLQNQNSGYKHLERLQAMGLIEWQSGKGQRLTVAGLAYLYQDAPLVDHPQPAPEDEKDYTAEWDAYVNQRECEHLNSVDYGSDEDTVIDNDDLPFSDVGVDDEDTKELPAVTVDESTPLAEYDIDISVDALLKGRTLSNLIDAALNPDDIEAYETLKAYDFASVPLWVLNVEFSDLQYLKWQLVDNSPREAVRAFEIANLLAERGAKADF